MSNGFGWRNTTLPCHDVGEVVWLGNGFGTDKGDNEMGNTTGSCHMLFGPMGRSFSGSFAHTTLSPAALAETKPIWPNLCN